MVCNEHQALLQIPHASLVSSEQSCYRMLLFGVCGFEDNMRVGFIRTLTHFWISEKSTGIQDMTAHK